jgi:hypothetical protein
LANMTTHDLLIRVALVSKNLYRLTKDPNLFEQQRDQNLLRKCSSW